MGGKTAKGAANATLSIASVQKQANGDVQLQVRMENIPGQNAFGANGVVIAGGLGFPVLFELERSWRRPSRWSLHTKLTLVMTGALIVGGTAAVLAFEWGTAGGWESASTTRPSSTSSRTTR